MVRRNYSYIPKRFIMNRNEYAFYKLLLMSVGYKQCVIPQVHLDELVKPRTSKQSRIFSFRHINQKSVDFVVCNTAGMHPVVAIELDGSSHSKDNTIARDAEVERILEQVRIPLLRFKNDEKVSIEELQKKIEDASSLYKDHPKVDVL